jgi:hypothetical protein
MALTLIQAAQQTTDLLLRGVIETVLEESPVLRYLPFETIVGNSLKYTQEVTPGAASFYAVGDTWSEGTATTQQKTANLAILGGDADVDNYLQRAMSDQNDQRATQIRLKAKAVARQFETSFIGGDTSSDPNAFDGLRRMIPSGQTLDAGANGAALTLSLLDQMLDLVRGGKPDLLLMSRRSRRKLKALLQASAHYVESGDQFGRQVMMYDGIPVYISDFQADTETLGSSGAVCSSIYALTFGWGDGLAGIQNGSIEAVDVGQLETKDAVRTRIRWYCGAVLFRDNACARLRGINAS